MRFELSGERRGWRTLKSHAVSALCVLCALATVAPLALVFCHLLMQGFSSLNWDFFTKVQKPAGEPGGGMAHAIVGTFVLLLLASALGIPVGVFGGVYLSEYSGRRANWLLRFLADVLNGVPSIVWGVVVYVMIVLRFRYSAYAGGVALAFIMIPLIMRTTEEVLLLVPGGYREAAVALGVPKWKMIVNVVLRTASKGIITGILIALARIAGETAPLIFTALGSRTWTRRLSEPIAALPLQIYTYAISPYDDWKRQAWAGALVLVSLIFLVNITVRYLTRDKS